MRRESIMCTSVEPTHLSREPFEALPESHDALAHNRPKGSKEPTLRIT